MLHCCCLSMQGTPLAPDTARTLRAMLWGPRGEPPPSWQQVSSCRIGGWVIVGNPNMAMAPIISIFGVLWKGGLINEQLHASSGFETWF
jgi:hypothetical protein